MQARDEANEAAFSSLGDLGEEEDEEEDRELREKKEKVSLLGLIPPLGEIDPRVMVEPTFNSETTRVVQLSLHAILRQVEMRPVDSSQILPFSNFPITAFPKFATLFCSLFQITFTGVNNFFLHWE